MNCKSTKTVRGILILGFLYCFSLPALAATPSCHEHSAGNYCVYSGKVSRLYINASNIILLYFESAVDVSVPAAVGININSGVAASLTITNENAEFARLFYSTALAAHMADKNITIQMRGTNAGYLKADRIWLSP